MADETNLNRVDYDDFEYFVRKTPEGRIQIVHTDFVLEGRKNPLEPLMITGRSPVAQGLYSGAVDNHFFGDGRFDLVSVRENEEAQGALEYFRDCPEKGESTPLAKHFFDVLAAA